MRKKIHRVRQPENCGRKQEAGEHCQPGHKPDFLLIRKQPRLSLMSVMVLHSALVIAFDMPHKDAFSKVFTPLTFYAFSQILAPLRGSSFIHAQSVIWRATLRPLEIAAAFRQNDRKRYRIDFVHSVRSV